MNEMGDGELLAQYFHEHREECFRALVERHSRMVYGCARRQVADHAMAQDIAQAVFLLLVRKGSNLKRQASIAGWLYRSTALIARDTLKQSRRRGAREHEAMNPNHEPQLLKDPSIDHGAWNELVDGLDACMDKLSEPDRNALLLRFFENRSLKEVASSLGLTEDTAQKRVSRSLQRLRRLLVQRGVAIPAATLASLVSAHGAPAIPASTQALLLSSGSAATVPSLAVTTLLKTSLGSILMNQFKTIAVISLIALCATGGVATYARQTRGKDPIKPIMVAETPLQLLNLMADSAAAHDGAKLRSAVHVIGQDRRQRLGALTQWIDSVGAFDRACRKAFADTATEIALWKDFPTVLYRLDFGQAYLADANQKIEGDTAVVNIQRKPGEWQFIRFEKMDGRWQINEEVVDDVASPSDAIKFSAQAPMLNQITRDVTAGKVKSPKEAMEKFMSSAITLPGSQ
jgi:RNA polymerase sigma factor (sigma-70 family)